MTNPRPIPPQDCGIGAAPSVARRPKGNLKRKPEVEWVVQLGPFTNGSITAPELVRPLEGPTDWLIKPRNGAIEPFDTASPTPKNVIRKYLNVGAQEDEAPRDLPKLSDGYVVSRNQPEPLPDLPGRPRENGLPGNDSEFPVDRIVTERVEVPVTRVVEREVPGETIIEYRDVIKYVCCDDKCPPKCEEPPKCDDDPKPPVCDDDPKPPVCEDDPKPPVCEDDPKPPVCEDDPKPPVCDDDPKPPVCDDNPKPPVCDDDKDPPKCEDKDPCKPDDVCVPKVDAKDDRAETTAGKPVTIDVLKNDEGVGKLKIESASADHGTVKIEGDKLLYTPKAGFEGKDTITYKITDQGCGSDDACVVVKVKDNVVECPPPKPTCPTPVSEDCSKSDCDSTVKVSSHDYSSSNKVLFENAVADSRDEMDQIIFDNKASVSALQSGQTWGESTYANAHSANASHVAPEPEMAAA